MYTAGTISGTKGSTKITGKSTQWLSNLYNILEGQVIIIYTPTSSNAYSIKNIKSNTEIELSRPLYDAVTNATYEIFTTIDNTTSDAAVKIATSIARNNEFMGLMNQWTTGTGTVTVNWGGEQVKLTTVDQMNKNIDGKFDKSGGDLSGSVKVNGSVAAMSFTAMAPRTAAKLNLYYPNPDTSYTHAYFQYNDGAEWFGRVEIPRTPINTSSKMMLVGDFGFGGAAKTVSNTTGYNGIKESSILKGSGVPGTPPGELPWGCVLHLQREVDRAVQLGFWKGNIGMRSQLKGEWDSQWFFAYTTANTTKDSNGNLKAASPIVKVFADHIELNDESEGVELKCLHTGIYQLKHVLGLNSDASWGGINGGITIPSGINQLPLIYVDYDVLVAGEQHPFNGEPVPQEEHGDIVIYTSYRKHFGLPQNVQRARLKTYPEFTKLVGDERVELENGAPVDIPAGHWVDVRVNMPSNSIYNQKQAEAEAYAKEEAERVAREEMEASKGEEA